jgi:hypothetical protein
MLARLQSPSFVSNPPLQYQVLLSCTKSSSPVSNPPLPPEAAGLVDYTNAARLKLSASSIVSMGPASKCRRRRLHQRGPPQSVGVADCINGARLKVSAWSITSMRHAMDCRDRQLRQCDGPPRSVSGITPLVLIAVFHRWC